jgi:hypothetical protein
MYARLIVQFVPLRLDAINAWLGFTWLLIIFATRYARSGLSIAPQVRNACLVR